MISPHCDVANGRCQQAEFAADLWQVHLGEGSSEYNDPQVSEGTDQSLRQGHTDPGQRAVTQGPDRAGISGGQIQREDHKASEGDAGTRRGRGIMAPVKAGSSGQQVLFHGSA